jgi:SAM-dependent methyltransferase
MTASEFSHYALGSTDAEHARLIRQAAWLAPHTERLFRDARIGSGHRVLDLGSGVGDVALIAARLVGPSGAVVGIDRDARSVERARARMVEAALAQVTIRQADIGSISSHERFDAAVGRYILMYLPDPVSALRSIAGLVRPAGALAFQEPDWTSFLEDAAPLPLWSAGASLLVETLQLCGTNTAMGTSLSRAFQEAGLPAPAVRSDRLIGSESWLPDCLHSMRPKMLELGLSLEPLGDFDSLHERLSSEISSFNTRTPLPGIVSAWCQTPATWSDEPSW